MTRKMHGHHHQRKSGAHKGGRTSDTWVEAVRDWPDLGLNEPNVDRTGTPPARIKKSEMERRRGRGESV